VPRRLLDLLSHVIIAVEVKDVSHKVEGVLIVLDIGVEPGQVEAVSEIVFVDFAKVFIASRRYKLKKQVLAHVAPHIRFSSEAKVHATRRRDNVDYSLEYGNCIYNFQWLRTRSACP